MYNICEAAYKDPNEYWVQDPDGFSAELEREILEAQIAADEDYPDYLPQSEQFEQAEQTPLPERALSSGFKLLRPPRVQTGPREALIEGWLYPATYCEIFSKPGIGKTSFGIDIFCSISSPELKSWHGYPIERHGGVVYLLGEGHYGFDQRLEGFRQYHNLSSENIFKSNAPLLFTESNKAVLFSEIDAFRASCPLPLAAVVIDTLNRHFDGDENKTADMSRFNNFCAEIITAFGATVAVLQHSGLADDERERGNSALRGAMDTVIQLKSKEVRDGKIITVIQKKQRDSELLPLLCLKPRIIEVAGWYEKNGRPCTAVVFDEAEDAECGEIKSPPKKPRRKTETARAIEAYLNAEAKLNIGESTTDAEGRRRVYIALTDWRDEFYKIRAPRPPKEGESAEEARKREAEANRSAFRTASAALIDSGFVEKAGRDEKGRDIFTRGENYGDFIR